MASWGVGTVGLPKASATKTEGLGDRVGTRGKSKLFYMFSEGASESRASSCSPCQRPGNQECSHLQAFARGLRLGGELGGGTVMLTKLYFRSKESDGLSLNAVCPSANTDTEKLQ